MRNPGETSNEGVTLIEMLVVMVVLGLVMSAATAMIITTHRAERYQAEMQATIDDGRLSMARLRKEIREARRIFPDSTGTELRAWVDQNLDTIPQAEELICYAVEQLPGGEVGQFQIVRWTGASLPGCSPVPSSGTSVVARTLVNDLVAEPPFNDYDPPPSTNPSDPDTRTVSLLFRLEVLNGRGPDTLLVEGTVRLRNVA